LTDEQALEAGVPGAAANLFQMPPPSRRRARPPVADGALLANLRLLGAAAVAGRPRLRETEADRRWDVGASVFFAAQTARVSSGRLAFVGQPHGHRSLVLVGRVDDSWAPSCEVSMLIRGC